jgi:hypothetical protein
VRVLCGDYSVLEIGRDLAERNEFVAFAIRRVVNPGLQAALDVHRGCRSALQSYFRIIAWAGLPLMDDLVCAQH